jgi:hypothetical protein
MARRKMRVRDPLRRERWLLYTIAVSGPVNATQIINILQGVKPMLGSGTILRADMRRLKQAALIDFYKKRMRGPKPAKFYFITRAGVLRFVTLLQGEQMFLEQRGFDGRKPIWFIEEVMSNQRVKDSVPEISALWSGIVESDLVQVATRRLREYCAGAYEEEVRRRMHLAGDEHQLNRLIADFLLQPFPKGDLDGERWRQALSTVPTLHDAAKKALSERVAELEQLRITLNL